jgi:UDP-N-acetylglucosamine--N-acetylmuramyl-(pentapeptide) pyrophosphoryl-undecaprenol N-acetylglucosamine transferase
MKTIVLTGGHPAPLIAMAEELTKRGYRIVVMGRSYAFAEAKHAQSYEKQRIEEMGLQFIDIPAVRMPSNLFQFISFTSSCLRAMRVVVQEFSTIRPDLVLTFGGYVSVPVGIVAGCMGVSLCIHDQTVKAGRANRWLAFVAKKVLVSWQDTERDFFPFLRHKVELTGNPLRKDFFLKTHTPSNRYPLLYITGGSAGSHAINDAVSTILQQLLEKLQVVHQTGDSHFKDYEKLAQLATSLSPSLQKKYKLVKFLGSEKISSIISSAYCVMGRSGANTVVEIATVGVPAIFIPLPYSQYNEQEYLARKLAAAGTALVVRQSELSGSRLLASLATIQENYQSFYAKAQQYRQSKEITVHQDACSRIADIIERVINNRRNLVSHS